MVESRKHSNKKFTSKIKAPEELFQGDDIVLVIITYIIKVTNK